MKHIKENPNHNTDLEKNTSAFFQRLFFLREVKSRESLPEPLGSEVAIVGRSNAGKSTLINKLSNNKSLARVSSTPGRTQSLVFFAIQKFAGFLVDLPGYGYAKTSKKNKKEWRTFVEGYLLFRHNLNAMVLVMDCRRSLQNEEKLLANLALQKSFNLLIVLSKCDKVGNNKAFTARKKLLTELQGNFGAKHGFDVFCYSSLQPNSLRPIADWVYKNLSDTWSSG